MASDAATQVIWSAPAESRRVGSDGALVDLENVGDGESKAVSPDESGLPPHSKSRSRPGEVIESNLLTRIQRYARQWGVALEHTFETETSAIAFGMRDQNSVALKVIKRIGDEWLSGKILETFDGHGVVRVYEYAPGAVLMERLRPGNSLVKMSSDGRDEEATDIFADVIQQMSAHASSITPLDLPKSCPTVHDWAKGFERYLATGDEQVPKSLAEAGAETYLNLCASQRRTLLLHGDLQHYNVLFDADRGWQAIDPKGVIGELEYEIGAMLRNPNERPDLFLSQSTIKRRLGQVTNRLNLDYERTVRWAFAQAVLSAIWEVEDGYRVDSMNPSLRLAEIIRPMLATHL